MYLEESEQTLIKKIKGIAFSFVVVCFSLVFFLALEQVRSCGIQTFWQHTFN